MTDEELKGFAMQCLNGAKAEMRQRRWNGFLLAVYNASEGFHRFRAIERTIAERLGEDWLDSGRKKDLAFGLIQECVRLAPPEAVGMVTAMNGFKPSQTLLALSPEEQERHLNGGHDHHHEMVAQGLLIMADVVCALVQTTERVCQCIQKVQGKKLFIGRPDVIMGDQEHYSGRTKMFGNVDEPTEEFIKRHVQ